MTWHLKGLDECLGRGRLLKSGHLEAQTSGYRSCCSCRNGGISGLVSSRISEPLADVMCGERDDARGSLSD